MILVVLGTWDKPFIRPLNEIEQAIKSGAVNEKVIVQSGNTEFETVNMEIVPFFDRIKLEQLYDEANVIICQAGVGSIMMGLERGKRIISIARLKKYDEHIDDHQVEILDVFSKNRYIIPWQENNFINTLQEARDFRPEKYPFGSHGIEDSIINYIEEKFK
jgi:UDP-N-acetylglucosamine transferase subunit ALG13